MDSGLVGGLAAAVFTPVILRALAAPGRGAQKLLGSRVLEYGNAYQALIGLVGTLFIALAVLAWRFPGRSGTIPVRPIAVFVGFAVFALVTLVLMRRARVLWNQDAVEGADLVGMRTSAGWSDLQEARFVPWATSVKLTFRAGQTVWVSPLMRGFEDFLADLEQHCAAAKIAPPEIPPSPYG